MAVEKDLPLISIVIPVYRSAAILPKLWERLRAILESEGRPWEIIMVDDASPDHSFSVMQELRAQDPRVRIVQFARNHGQQHATLCGLNYARGSEIVTIDDDLQNPPEEIPKLLSKLREGFFVVIGRISEKKKHGWWRNIGTAVNQYLAEKIIAKPRSLYLSSFRALSRAAVDRITRYKGAHPHISALLLKSVPVQAIVNVNVAHASRPIGSSTYSLRKLTKTASYLLINHSYIPLRFMTAWGFILSILSLLLAGLVVVRVLLFGHTAPGWPSLVVLIAFLSGNVLMALGIVGEYLGRLVEEYSVTEQFAIHREEV